MKTLNDIACAAYAAHAKELARRIGVNSRPWTDIGSCEQKCWEQAAKQVLAEAAAMGMDMQKVAPEIDLQSVSPVGWTRDNTATFNTLLLVAGHELPFQAVESWTDMQCMQAEQWAMATHLHASDNDDVEVPDMPPHVRTFPPRRKPIGGAS